MTVVARTPLTSAYNAVKDFPIVSDLDSKYSDQIETIVKKFDDVFSENYEAIRFFITKVENEIEEEEPEVEEEVLVQQRKSKRKSVYKAAKKVVKAPVNAVMAVSKAVTPSKKSKPAEEVVLVEAVEIEKEEATTIAVPVAEPVEEKKSWFKRNKNKKVPSKRATE